MRGRWRGCGRISLLTRRAATVIQPSEGGVTTKLQKAAGVEGIQTIRPVRISPFHTLLPERRLLRAKHEADKGKDKLIFWKVRNVEGLINSVLPISTTYDLSSKLHVRFSAIKYFRYYVTTSLSSL